MIRVRLSTDALELLSWRSGVPIKFDNALGEGVLIIGRHEYWASLHDRAGRAS